MSDYSKVGFVGNGKLKLLIIVGTRPEIIQSYTGIVDRMVWRKEL